MSEDLRRDVDKQLARAWGVHEDYLARIQEQQQRLAELTRSEIKLRQEGLSQSLEQFKRQYDEGWWVGGCVCACVVVIVVAMCDDVGSPSDCPSDRPRRPQKQINHAQGEVVPRHGAHGAEGGAADQGGDGPPAAAPRRDVPAGMLLCLLPVSHSLCVCPQMTNLPTLTRPDLPTYPHTNIIPHTTVYGPVQQQHRRGARVH